MIKKHLKETLFAWIKICSFRVYYKVTIIVIKRSVAIFE